MKHTIWILIALSITWSALAFSKGIEPLQKSGTDEIGPKIILTK